MPTIRLNNSTGGTTTVSGSNGGITANGTSASFSGSVVTLDGSPDLSGFDADEDVLWLQTTSGRQWFDLSAADDGADTVTCVDAPAGTSTGLTWGIGGKLSANSSGWGGQRLARDCKGGWTIDFEYTGTEYKLQSATDYLDFDTTNAADDADNPIVVTSSSYDNTDRTGTRPTFEINGVDAGNTTVPWLAVDNNNHVELSNICWYRSTATYSGPMIRSFAGAGRLTIMFCEVYCTGTATTGPSQGNVDGIEWNVNNTTAALYVRDCYFYDVGGSAIQRSSGGHGLQRGITIERCVFDNCSTGGSHAVIDLTSIDRCLIKDCIISESGKDGIEFRGQAGMIINCVIDNCDAIGIHGEANDHHDYMVIQNCQITNNTGLGISQGS